MKSRGQKNVAKESLYFKKKPLFSISFFLILFFSMFCISCSSRIKQNHSPFFSNQLRYRLLLFADAKGLDYSSGQALCQALQKCYRRSRGATFGHAWIRLEGWTDGRFVAIEGGHTGETGVSQPRYFEGVMRYLNHQDPNPVRYLWQDQCDGYFELGSGGHLPTHVATIFIDKATFEVMQAFIKSYPFHRYNITSHQCTTFVVEIAKLAHVMLDDKVVVCLEQEVELDGEKYLLWKDKEYQLLTLATPDALVAHPLFQRIGSASSAAKAPML